MANNIKVTSLILMLILSMTNLSACRPLNMLDLSYGYEPETPAPPFLPKFESRNKMSVTLANNSFQTAEFYGSEHSGTHMDAPYHFNKDKLKLDELPLELFEGPGVILDITYKADIVNNPDAAVTLDDVEKWEKANGRIPEGSMVLVHTGWGKYAYNSTLYTGSDGSSFQMHFPSFSGEVCELLIVSRKVNAIGSDTLSVDVGNSSTFPCHKVLADFNAIGLENVANVDQLPPKGSYIKAYPMKIVGGTGAPTRVIATIDHHYRSQKN